ncbi:tetratricopeptide repeat protein [Butyrivibrio sp. DSM 10294]|uniref:tetratricopeptide repeat protein n=1 Tax=Butyrivibrio sp. DSM 10294 TaxID=2972457 RepID=UPI00234E7BDE|nr:tetratricopeptide repeat protein [Butyrivibrio sp. DSM 10294]MDC7294746.1 tetratricopeptide repeat protein [Butyrivibrio sp. DSM 10294]
MNKKKFPVLMPVLAVVGTILLVLGLSMIIRVGINHSFISDYNNNVYASDKEEGLLVMNVPESYLPYYNLGNVSFKNGDYNGAIAYYNQALALNPPGKRECKVRINLALAMVYSIDLNHLDSQEKIDTALIILYKARDTLTTNGWAADNPADARDATAQQLKEDIDKLIEQLENPPEGGSGGSSEQNEPDSGESGDQGQGQSSGGDDAKNKKKLESQQKGALDEKSREQDDLEKSYGGQKYGSGSKENNNGEGSDSGYSNPW